MLYRVQVPRCWGGCRAAPVRGGQGCPVPDTAGSSWLQEPRRRARPSPAAERVVSLGDAAQERAKHCMAAVRERGVREKVRNSPADTEVREGGGAGGAPGAGAEIPLRPVERTMVMQVVAQQPMETPRWSRLLAGATAHGEEPTLDQGFLAEAVAREGPTLEQGEQGVADMKCCDLAATTVPHPRCAARARGGSRRVRSGTEPGKKGAVGRAFRFVFANNFSLSYSIFNWQRIKLIFPKLSLFCL